MKPYTILQVNAKQNKEDILPILIRNLKEASNSTYSWKYEQCPFGEGLCWLAKDEKTNSFVGSAALFYRKLFINEKPALAALAGDFAVNKEHRAYGPALMLQKTIQSCLKNNGFAFIYSVPNKLSESLFLKIGYKEIGRFNKFVKVLKAEYKTNTYLPPSFITKMFSGLIDFVIAILSKEKRYIKTFNYSINFSEVFDERFDILWQKALKQFNIIGERTTLFLNWRYKQSPLHGYKIFAITKNKDVLGYIVYYIKDNMCHIVDMLFVNSEGILNALLAEFMFFMRQNSIGSISVYYLGNKNLERKLKEFNFFIREKEDGKVVIYSPDISSESDLLNKENWHFFGGDNDV